MESTCYFLLSPSWFQELTDITLVCKDYLSNQFTMLSTLLNLAHYFSQIQEKCKLSDSLGKILSLWRTILLISFFFKGGLSRAWEEKIFGICRHGCCSNLLPKGEFFPKISLSDKVLPFLVWICSSCLNVCSASAGPGYLHY